VIDIAVRVNTRSADVLLRELSGDRGLGRATARALNRTAITVRAEAARLLQAKRALPIGQIKGSMDIKRATPRNQVAKVTVSGKPIPLRYFATAVGHYRGSHGVSIRIEKGVKRTRLIVGGRKAFVNPKWNPNIFVRTGVVYGGNHPKQQIEKRPPVPGLPTVLVQDAIVKALKTVIGNTFPRRFNEEMNYEINVAKQKASAVG